MTPRRASLALVIAVALAYATAFLATFQFDDFHLVVGNPDVAGWAAWAASMPGIRPLTKASFVVSRSLSLGTSGYVVVSLACHIVATLCLFAVLRQRLAVRDHAAHTTTMALVAALLFALHPAQTEAVTYVSGRSVVLAGALYLASLWLQTRRQAGVSVASLTLFAAALMARETAWTLPFALVLANAAGGHPWRDAFHRTRWHFAVLAIGLAVILASPTYRYLLATSLSIRSPLENLFAQVSGIAYLVAHPLLTLRLSFDPDLAPSTTIDGAWLGSFLLLLALLGASLLLWHRQRWIAAGVLWFLLHVIPTNGAVARFDLVNDRQLYLAMAGPAWIVAIALSSIGHRTATRVVAITLVAVLASATLLRNTDYRSEAALWEATARVSPNKPRVWNNLGYARQQAGDVEPARAAYLRALALDPTYSRARINLDRLDRPPGEAR